MLKTYDLGVFLSEALKFWGRLLNFDRETHQRMAQRLQALCFDVLAFRCSCFFVCSCIPSAKPGLRVYCTETARHLNAQGANLGAQGADLGAQGADLGAQGANLGAQGANLNAQGANLGAQGANLGAQGADLSAQSADLGAQGADLGAHGCIIGRLYEFYKLCQILCFLLKIGSSSADVTF